MQTPSIRISRRLSLLFKQTVIQSKRHAPGCRRLSMRSRRRTKTGSRAISRQLRLRLKLLAKITKRHIRMLSYQQLGLGHTHSLSRVLLREDQ